MSRELPAILNVLAGVGLVLRHTVAGALRQAERQVAGMAPPPVDPGRALDTMDAALVLGALAVGSTFVVGYAAILGDRDATRRTVGMGLGWCVYAAASTWRMGDHTVGDRALFAGGCLAWTLAVLAYAKEDTHALWAPVSLAMAILVMGVTGSPVQRRSSSSSCRPFTSRVRSRGCGGGGSSWFGGERTGAGRATGASRADWA